jgi:hypothetical protein
MSGDWNIVDEPSLVTEAQVRHAEELQQKLQQHQSIAASSSSSSPPQTNQFAHSIKLQVIRRNTPWLFRFALIYSARVCV